MFRRNRTLFSVIVLTSSASAYGDWTYNPSTGHWYRLTTSFGTWVQANDEATAAGGYLTTICSQEENSWVTQLATIAAGATERSGEGNNAWIGYRDAGAGWGWENGEICGYTNLHPNWNSYSLNHAYILGADHGEPGFWGRNQLHDNDFIRNVRGIIELDCPPGIACPTISEWGLVAMGLLTVTAGTVVVMRRRVANA